MPKYGVISGPYFPVFVLNMEIYELNPRIQSEYRKRRTKHNSVFGHFSHSLSHFSLRNQKLTVFQESIGEVN